MDQFNLKKRSRKPKGSHPMSIGQAMRRTSNWLDVHPKQRNFPKVFWSALNLHHLAHPIGPTNKIGQEGDNVKPCTYILGSFCCLVQNPKGNMPKGILLKQGRSFAFQPYPYYLKKSLSTWKIYCMILRKNIRQYSALKYPNLSQ